ncbi:MAG: hypothetical protein ACYS0G_08620 [Planctomycetota bacterium]
MTRVLEAGLLVACALGAGQAQAGLIQDQTQELLNASFNMDADILEWQQEVTVGVAGPLAQIDVNVSQTGSAMFYLNVGSPWQNDANDFQVLFVGNTPGWHTIDVSSANLIFDVGDTFVMGWIGGGTGLWMGGGFIDNGDPYPAGDLYLNGAPHTPGNNWDLAFRTYVVPAPGPLLLLGLAALAGRRRRR